MSVRVIQERLESYGCNSSLEEEQALREITQEVMRKLEAAGDPRNWKAL